MKKYFNGQYIELTPEEIAEMLEAAKNVPDPVPTIEERIEAIEQAILELILGGGL